MKRLILCLTLGILTCSPLLAQKFGFVNSAEVLQAMPEIKQLQTTLEAEQKKYAGQYEKMYAEYQEKYVYLQKNQESLMEAVLETELQALQQLEQRIAQFEKSAQEKLLKFEEEKTLPILDKAKKTIETVAKELGYTYVFDNAQQILVVAPDADDITQKVIAKL